MEATLVQVPAGPPRACICGSITGPFVDTGFTTVDVYSIYVCEKCCATIAATMGYATPESVQALEAKIAELEQEVADTRDALTEARDARVHTEASTRAAIREEVREALAEMVPPVASLKRESPVPPKAA